MNAAEQLVEAYFQHVGGCFTRGDVKVSNGVGRQFDLVALKLSPRQAFHIEVDVTHELGWCRKPAERSAYIEKKFFGAPPERKGASAGRTDFERGKTYFNAILAQYERLGLASQRIQRVLVSWVLHEDHTVAYRQLDHESNAASGSYKVHFISFRNLILPALLQEVGKSNYENEMLRVLSLTKQRLAQVGAGA